MVITLLVCILVGAAAAWTGQAIGERFWDAPRDTEIVSESAARLRVTVSGIFAAAIVFIVIFIFTATPPV